MKILDVLTLTEDRLHDSHWLERLVSASLRESFCLLGTEELSLCLHNGGQSYQLQAGQMLLLPPGHNLHIDANACCVFPAKRKKIKTQKSGVPTPASAAETARQGGFVGAVFFRPDIFSDLPHVLHLLQRQPDIIAYEHVRLFFSSLYQQFASHSVFALQAAYHGLSALLYQFAAQAVRASSTDENNYVEKALELMNMHVYDTLSLESLVEELHISEAHFIRLFKKEMQISPMKYFMRHKVHTAAAMLVQGIKIKDAAEKTGFYNDAHFSRQFKKYMGIPPREYKLYHTSHIKSSQTGNQEALYSITHVLADFIDALPDMVFFKDTLYVYRLCNAAFTTYAGRSKEDIYGHTDFTIFRPDIAAAYRYHDERVIRTLQPRANEEWVIYPDGRAHYVEAFKAPFFGPQQELLGIVAVCRDITERNDTPCPFPPDPHSLSVH